MVHNATTRKKLRRHVALCPSHNAHILINNDNFRRTAVMYGFVTYLPQTHLQLPLVFLHS